MPFVKNLTNQAQVLKYTQQLTKAKKMKTSGIFLPFWNLFAAIFVYYLFMEGLKKCGLIKSK